MKKTLYPIMLLIFTSILPAEMDHLIISEIVLQPSNTEYVSIYNPTDAPVDLTNYYLTDATDVEDQRYYYKLTTGADYMSTSSMDFMVRFPAGQQLAAKATLVISMVSKTDFSGTVTPDLSIKEDFLPAIAGHNTIGSAPYYLDNTAETLILFYWDGSSSTVQDVDYVLWGNNYNAIDKSGVPGYQNDTPVAQQKFAPNHLDGQKLQRIADEGSEIQSGGNGITGHDETSENFAETWAVVALENTKPKISGVSFSPVEPVVGNPITISATVTDDSMIAEVNLVYIFQSVRTKKEMTEEPNNIFSATIGPFDVAAQLDYYIIAKDTTGLKDSTLISSIIIKELPEVLTIRTIRDNWSAWNGETVTLTGVVTIGSGILRTDFTSAYFQDISGRGLNLYSSSVTDLQKGDSIKVTGELEKFVNSSTGDIIYELSDFTSEILATGVPIPGVVTVPIAALNSAPADYEGTYLTINGTVAERADNIGGGSNVIIEDVTGRTTVRIWNSANILVNSLREIVNDELDSLLTTGNMVEIRGVASLYNSEAQILLGYAEDVQPWIPGEPGQERTKLTVAPYPFVPKLGEVIHYSYEYPSNSRVILRVYDMAGRFVISLEDDYFALSWKKENTWDGRNELNELVSPGTYIFHLESTNRTTGKSAYDIAPVVIGVKF